MLLSSLASCGDFLEKDAMAAFYWSLLFHVLFVSSKYLYKLGNISLLVGVFSENTIKTYPVDCLTTAAFPYANQNILAFSPYVQCKILLGKHSHSPEPATMTYINGTFERSHMFSYSTGTGSVGSGSEKSR